MSKKRCDDWFRGYLYGLQEGNDLLPTGTDPTTEWAKGWDEGREQRISLGKVRTDENRHNGD